MATSGSVKIPGYATSEARFSAEALTRFGTALLERHGLAQDRARDVAEILVEGELLGKPTHGYSLLPRYAKELDDGGMAKDGDPIVLRDGGVCAAWDARKLPGPWVTLRAMDWAMERAGAMGLGAVTFQRSHHLAALGAFLKRATDRGFMMLLTLIDNTSYSVAPFGGVGGVLTSNPIAFGAPTNGDPILIDTTTSLVSNGMAALYRTKGEPLPHPFVMDNRGNATTDARVLVSDPPGTILPVGGIESGFKGYGIGLIVELLTGCLSGHGRADPGEGWNADAFLLMINPAFLGGNEAYLRQVSHLADLIHASPPRPGFDRVRLPGEGGMERRRVHLEQGIALPQPLIDELAACAGKAGIAFP